MNGQTTTDGLTAITPQRAPASPATSDAWGDPSGTRTPLRGHVRPAAGDGPAETTQADVTPERRTGKVNADPAVQHHWRPRQSGTRRGRNGGGKRVLIALALLATVAIVGYAVYRNNEGVQSQVDDFIGRLGGSAATPTETPLDIEGRVQAAVATAQAPPSLALDVRATTEAAIASTVEALLPTPTTEAVSLATTTLTKIPATREAIPTRTPTKVPTARPTATHADSHQRSSRAADDTCAHTYHGPQRRGPSPTPTSSVSFRGFHERTLAGAGRPTAGLLDQGAGVGTGRNRRRAESEAIQSMLYIAVTSRSVVSSLVSLDWVRGRHQRRRGRGD